MLTYESLVAARAAIFHGANPLEVRQLLLDLDSSESKDSLLFVLLKKNLLSDEKARLAHKQVQHYMFLRAESAYIHVLRHLQRVSPEDLDHAKEEQRQEEFADRIGSYLVRAENLTPDLDLDTKHKALIALEKQNQQNLDEGRQNEFFNIQGSAHGMTQTLNVPTMGEQVQVSQIVSEDQAKDMLANLQQFMDVEEDEDSQAMEPPQNPSKTAALPRRVTPPPSTPSLPPLPEIPDIALAKPTKAPTNEDKKRLTTRTLPREKLEVDNGPLAGTGLATRYQVVDKLGQGGMGAVYLAYDKEEERQVALKVALKGQDDATNEDAVKRFRREILCNSFFQHPNVIDIYDGGLTDDGSYFMAMEYFKGEPLSDKLERDGAFTITECLDIFKHALLALQAAHDANIVHRDIKPENFMIASKTGEPLEMKLMDFGIARILDDEQDFSDQFFKTMQGKLTGSPAYIAPESITEPKIDQRADLYSLGIMLFELCVGKLPFKAPTAQEYLSKHLYEKPPDPCELGAHRSIPRSLGDMILRLLEKLPRKRYQNVKEVLAVVEHKVLPDLEKPKKPQMTMKFDSERLMAEAGPDPAKEPEKQDQKTEDKDKGDEGGWFSSLKKKILGS